MNDHTTLRMSARHLELICRRVLRVVRANSDAAASVADIDAELEDLYGLRPRFPFDMLIADIGLDAEEAALTTFLMAWSLLPDERPLLREGPGAPLTIGHTLELLFAGSGRRISARELLRADRILVARGLVVIHDAIDADEGSSLLDQQRLRVMPWLPEFLVSGGLDLPREIARLHRPASAQTLPPLLIQVARVMSERRNLREHEGTLLMMGPADELGPPIDGLATTTGRSVLRVSLERLDASSAAGFETRLRELAALASFADAILFFEGATEILGSLRACRALLAACARHRSAVVVGTEMREDAGFRRGYEALRRQALASYASEAPTYATRRCSWELSLARSKLGVAPTDVAALARQFAFGPADVERTIELAGATDYETLVATARELVPQRLSEFSVRVPADLDIESLVVPAETRSVLRELIAACRARVEIVEAWGFNRSIRAHGVIALFDGEPGTGKTLTAGVIANALGLPLYRIDVARVVDKYVGETEKHIATIFEAARASHAVLLFDEADALFTKRTSVSSSMDRFANMQTNMLLQQVESYDGVVILTTNLEGNFDPAMRRRIHFKVTFPFPSPEERSELWRRLMPSRAPVADDIDFEMLGAAFELSGGYIKNAVVRASYRAWSSASRITTTLIEEAAAAECRAAGKLFRALDQHRSLASPPRPRS